MRCWTARYSCSVSANITETDLILSETQKVIPAFGWHPWFSHQMFDESDYDGAKELDADQKVKHYQRVLVPKPEEFTFLHSLPDPRPFGHFIGQTERFLERYPLALVGEVGLDRSFRIPESWLPEQAENRNDSLTPGGREGRKLSPYRVNMDHQKKVLLAQLRLAGKKQRAASVHGVQAHGIVYETISESWKGYEKHVPSKRERRRKQEGAAKIGAEAVDAGQEEGPTRPSEPKPFPPRICLHSFSGPAETAKMYIAPSVPCDVYFSFSTTINNWSDSNDGKVEAAVRAVPDDRIVVESDLHTAGADMDRYLEEVVRKICHVKKWDLESGVRQLRSNWHRFVFGLDTSAGQT